MPDWGVFYLANGDDFDLSGPVQSDWMGAEEGAPNDADSTCIIALTDLPGAGNTRLVQIFGNRDLDSHNNAGNSCSSFQAYKQDVTCNGFSH